MNFSLDGFSLKGKVALVTGGSRGIGKAIAIGLANAGADVALASRKLPDLEEVAKEFDKMKAFGDTAQSFATFVRSMKNEST